MVNKGNSESQSKGYELVEWYVRIGKILMQDKREWEKGKKVKRGWNRWEEGKGGIENRGNKGSKMV